jgi:hypothetical protein
MSEYISERHALLNLHVKGCSFISHAGKHGESRGIHPGILKLGATCSLVDNFATPIALPPEEYPPVPVAETADEP